MVQQDYLFMAMFLVVFFVLMHWAGTNHFRH